MKSYRINEKIWRNGDEYKIISDEYELYGAFWNDAVGEDGSVITVKAKTDNSDKYIVFISSNPAPKKDYYYKPVAGFTYMGVPIRKFRSKKDKDDIWVNGNAWSTSKKAIQAFIRGDKNVEVKQERI